MTIHVVFKQDYDTCQLAMDIHIPANGVTAVFGPSGAGKSTLLRVISGLEKLDNAYVNMNGHVYQSNEVFVATHERQVAMVFQQPSLFEHMTVEQNIN